MNAHS